MTARRFPLNPVLFACVVAGLLSVPAHAAVPVVKTVPWVSGQPLMAHTTYAGRSVRLKGTAESQGVALQYQWDFGDGTTSVPQISSDGHALEASHVYTGPIGQVWSARLTVTNLGTGESASRAYYVEMKARTLEAESNVAIDDGLWYLHKTQYRTPAGCTDCGNWQTGGYASLAYHGVTAANLNAFLVNGHSESASSDNPYAETVRRGLRFLLTQLSPRGVGTQPDPVNGGSYNPDVNFNGIGLYNPQYESYQTGMILSALVATGTPGAVAGTGGSGVIGRTYLDIAQDIVDSISYCQYDSSMGGGWYYTCNGPSDNSISQWMSIGLLGARSFGAQLPQHPGTSFPNVVPQLNKLWLRASQVPANPPLYNNGGGYFGYQNQSTVWGPFATTPSGMVQMAMDGIGRGTSPATGPSWEGAETFLRETWDSGLGPDASIKDYYYGLFSFTKAMLLHDPVGSGVPQPIKCLISSRQGTYKWPTDWYGAQAGQIDACSGRPAASDGVARTLINDQYPDGFWYGHSIDSGQLPFETAWAIMMLNRTVFESGVPVAVAKATPSPAVAYQVVTLDGAESFHQDSSRRVTAWQWDFDADGVWDASGPVVTRSFPALGDYPVTLRVTDDATPAKSTTTQVVVKVSLPPLAPTANASGPYNFCPLTPRWFLDAGASVNPDQGLSEPGRPGDTIQSYGWDLDGDGLFTDASGLQPDVKPYFQNLAAGSYRVQLKVTDTTATSFPSSGLGNLGSVATATVNVRAAGDPACSCVADLAARAKSGKIQLTWTAAAGAAGHNVYRGTINGGPYKLLGTTTTRYATFLDSTATNGVSYHYVVRPVADNSDELCQSNQATGLASAR